jgi:hypothetical protein
MTQQQAHLRRLRKVHHQMPLHELHTEMIPLHQSMLRESEPTTPRLCVHIPKHHNMPRSHETHERKALLHPLERGEIGQHNYARHAQKMCEVAHSAAPHHNQ